MPRKGAIVATVRFILRKVGGDVAGCLGMFVLAFVLGMLAMALIR